MTELELIEESIYEYPRYYDLVYGLDWKAEYDFLVETFRNFVPFPVHHVFEPACGTGRLIYRFAKSGLAVQGNDLNHKAIKFCNERLTRNGFPASAMVGDMTDFKLEHPVDAAFNTINSFRHLCTERLAQSHLQCVARALKPGGIYVLGLHLSPEEGFPTCDSESWSASRGYLTVNTRMWLVERNYPERYETFGMTFDVYTPTRQFQIRDEVNFRTYTLEEIQSLVDSVSDLKIEAAYDFRYDLDEPIELESSVEDVVLILKKIK